MIHHGDLFDVLPTLADASLDACVTDPPYGIGFMGKKWDTFAPGEGQSRIVPNREIDSDNPNLKGRSRGSASSPSAVEYDRSLRGQHEFQVWTERWAREVLRVVKPGAHVLVCGAPRSYHRMASGLEDAGFEIRDCLAWIFSQGFPKSLNFGCKCGGNYLPYSHAGLSTPERDVRSLRDTDVSEAVNTRAEQDQVLLDGMPKQAVSEYGSAPTTPRVSRREQPIVEGRDVHRAGEGLSDDSDAGPSEGESERLRAGAHRDRGEDSRPAPETERGSTSHRQRQSEQRSGKSASLRLPSRTLDDRASNRRARCERCGGVTEARGLGTALKPAYEPIILARKPLAGTVAENFAQFGTGAINVDWCRVRTREILHGSTARDDMRGGRFGAGSTPNPGDIADYEQSDLGRWPSNVALDEEAAAMLDAQSGELGLSAGTEVPGEANPNGVIGFGDSGGASRFFYVAKPSRAEREIGCHDFSGRQRDESRKEGNPGGDNPRNRGLQRRGNHHPTVKPIELMRWLVRLVTPSGGFVLDPFVGSGTTGCACAFEGCQFIGIEREAEYVAIAERRIAACVPLLRPEVSA